MRTGIEDEILRCAQNDRKKNAGGEFSLAARADLRYSLRRREIRRLFVGGVGPGQFVAMPGGIEDRPDRRADQRIIFTGVADRVVHHPALA